MGRHKVKDEVVYLGGNYKEGLYEGKGMLVEREHLMKTIYYGNFKEGKKDGRGITFFDGMYMLREYREDENQ